MGKKKRKNLLASNIKCLEETDLHKKEYDLVQRFVRYAGRVFRI